MIFFFLNKKSYVCIYLRLSLFNGFPLLDVLFVSCTNLYEVNIFVLLEDTKCLWLSDMSVCK